MKLNDDGHCFVCGKNNKLGLKLDWATEGKKTWTTFVPAKHHQGYVDVVHGGILSGVLDEAMGRLAWLVYGPSVSAELVVRFHHPALVGQTLKVTGEIGELKKRLIAGKARIETADGVLIATAEAKMLRWHKN